MSTLISTRLSFAEVERYVGYLADDVLEQLASGPLPDDVPAGAPDFADCRVCRALKPHFAATGFAAAKVLIDWHEFLEDYKVVTAARDTLEIAEEVDELFGALSYARCCAIYSAAKAELERRRERQAALGPVVDAIERALPRNLYVRKGCEFEHASRPVLAGTIALALEGRE